MKYITGILNFLERGPSSDSGRALPIITNNTASQRTSCYGWSRPDPAVRLRLSDNNVVRIFGYPAKEDIPPEMEIPFVNMGNGGSPLLYLRGHVPAYVSYIMGDDWRSRLRGDHRTSDAHLCHDGKVILLPSAAKSLPQEPQEDLEASERTHCLRMRRCGAVAVRSEVDVVLRRDWGRSLANSLVWLACKWWSVDFAILSHANRAAKLYLRDCGNGSDE